ncbi:MAG: hypothetical protein M0R32_02520 [Candidatus Cloacimonetes bacterium]|jgi:hypothetical protein|nr:hypothetical protein [Candidatus Cloacimonadota bacterium]
MKGFEIPWRLEETILVSSYHTDQTNMSQVDAENIGALIGRSWSSVRKKWQNIQGALLEEAKVNGLRFNSTRHLHNFSKLDKLVAELMTSNPDLYLRLADINLYLYRFEPRNSQADSGWHKLEGSIQKRKKIILVA